MDIDLIATDCPVCGSKESIPLFRDVNRREGLKVESSYCRCLGCSAVYLNPTLDESKFKDFDAIFVPKKPKKGTSRVVSLLGGVHNNTIHGWLNRQPGGSGAGKKILDVGCSSGEKLVDFKKRGYQVFGVDLAPEAIDRANKRFGGGFAATTLEHAEFPGDFFEVIRIDSTLEHIQSPRDTLDEAYRILKPGGMLCIYVPNGRSLSLKILKGASANSWIPFHVVLYTREALGLALSRVGFMEILTVTHTPPGLIIQTLAQALGTSERKNVDLGIWGFLLSLALLPATLFMSLLPRGEELVAFAKKPLAAASK